MAWNKYYIFIKNPDTTDVNNILSNLGLGGYEPAKEASLWDTNKPTTLFMGFYNGNLLIVHPDLAFQFFTATQSNAERRFINLFPNSEIAALVENETVGLFAFAIIDGGKKIRMKDGSDGEVYNDLGDLLPEEIDLLSETIFSEEELEEMKGNDMSDEEIQAAINFETSYRVPNRLSKRYLGETVLEINTPEIKLTMYTKC